MQPHLNSPDVLPPVSCPIIIQIPCGKLVRAERTRHIEQRNRDMEYRLEDGRVVVGRYRWTYV